MPVRCGTRVARPARTTRRSVAAMGLTLADGEAGPGRGQPRWQSRRHRRGTLARGAREEAPCQLGCAAGQGSLPSWAAALRPADADPGLHRRGLRWSQARWLVSFGLPLEGYHRLHAWLGARPRRPLAGGRLERVAFVALVVPARAGGGRRLRGVLASLLERPGGDLGRRPRCWRWLSCWSARFSTALPCCLAGGLPRWCGSLLRPRGPAAVVDTLYGVYFIPHGTMLPISIVSAAIGVLLLLGRGGRATGAATRQVVSSRTAAGGGRPQAGLEIRGQDRLRAAQDRCSPPWTSLVQGSSKGSEDKVRCS